MMRGMKYSQFQVLPAASFVCKGGGDEKVGKPHLGAWPPGPLRKVQARSLGLVRPVPAPQRLLWAEASRGPGKPHISSQEQVQRARGCPGHTEDDLSGLSLVGQFFDRIDGLPGQLQRDSMVGVSPV